MAVKAPKNVKITRKAKNKFEISWKLGQNDYSDQELIWYEVYKNTSKSKASETKHKVKGSKIGKKSTSFAFKIDFSDYPETGTKRLYKIRAEVRGKKGQSYSAWSKSSFDLKVPKSPKVLSKPGELTSNVNTVKYSWGESDKGKNVFYKFQYQVAEVPNFGGTKLSEVDWDKYVVRDDKGNTSFWTTAGSVEVPVSALPEHPNTLTQVFRIRAYGPRGFSSTMEKAPMSWYVFGAPQKAFVDESKTSVVDNGRGYNIEVEWTAEQTKYGNPIDSTVVRYAVGQPRIIKTISDDWARFELTYPTSGLSWTSKSPLLDTKNEDRLCFDTETKPEVNQCMFIQVNTNHGPAETTTAGDIQALRLGNSEDSLYGTLQTPTLRTADYEPETKLVRIEATNNSDVVSGSYMAVFASNGNSSSSTCIGILLDNSGGTFKVPDEIAAGDSIIFGVQALVADYSPVSQSSSEATVYEFGQSLMESSVQWSGGTISKPPKLSLRDLGGGTILAEWNWSWTEAQSAELSWSTDQYAWESTNEPSRYVISNNKAGRWRIPDLEYGATYYVRIRLIKTGDDYETYGLYSEPVPITIRAEAPPTPVLTLDPVVVAPGGEVRCTWGYAAEDGSTQMQAEIVEVITSGGSTEYKLLTKVDTSQNCTLYLGQANMQWDAGSTHAIAVRTYSSFNTFSQYSSIVNLQVADPLVVGVTLGDGFSVASQTIEDETVTWNELKRFPFTVTITGAGENGTTAMYIRRAEGHELERPDESRQYGFEEETILLVSEDADGIITIDSISDEHIIGDLDDTEDYILTAVAQDKFGQTASAEVPFTINWDIKAKEPSADIAIDYDYNVALITPQADADDGATCDIYRLSSGKPELIFRGGIFGETYVDPYPAIGRFGGYRIVYRSKYGDYITNDNTFAWTDYGYDDGAAMQIWDAIIDFGDDQISIPFNLDLSHTWKKEFIETKYLGGAVQGDWNEGVSHTMKVSTDVAVEYYSDTYLALRRLANYAGVCHVRTPDGSSFAANVEVNETQEQRKINMIAKFSLDITRVDSENAAGDGMLFSEWITQ